MPTENDGSGDNGGGEGPKRPDSAGAAFDHFDGRLSRIEAILLGGKPDDDQGGGDGGAGGGGGDDRPGDDAPNDGHGWWNSKLW